MPQDHPVVVLLLLPPIKSMLALSTQFHLQAGALALLVASLAVVLSVWPDPRARVLALVGLAILYGLGAFAAFLRMRKRIQGEGMPFADTVAEFQRDREWLSSRR
jgi:uncharacterized membrane protein YqjE